MTDPELGITPEEKAAIDALSYRQLLAAWRFAPAGDARFHGARGTYWSKRMGELRAADPEGAVADSKSLGWGRL